MMCRLIPVVKEMKRCISTFAKSSISPQTYTLRSAAPEELLRMSRSRIISRTLNGTKSDSRWISLSKFSEPRSRPGQKTCDDRLKKIIDEQSEVRNKLSHLTKKDSPSFMQKDLGDIVYEKKITKNMFVNTYGSELMTTILVVVNKKKIE